MDADRLFTDLSVFASSGVVFSNEQRVALQNSLTKVKVEYQFSRIEFWGKITALKDDYYRK